jgi:hypothetical protein
MKISQFVEMHTLSDDWSESDGSVLYCTCGWKHYYNGKYVEAVGKHDEHVDEEAAKAGIGHIPTVVNEIVDKMVNDRQFWCRDMRTKESEDFHMNRIFNELKYEMAVYGIPEGQRGNAGQEFIFPRTKGPLL